jgi:hypothetical protein
MSNEHTAQVRVVMTDHRQGRVFIDGRELQDVVRIEFTASVNGASRLTVELQPRRVEIEGPAEFELTPEEKASEECDDLQTEWETEQRKLGNPV